MRSIEWSFYDAETGVLAPVCSLLPEGADPRGFAPPGCVPHAGRLDPQTQRVDPQTGQVVAYRPPAPADDALRTWAWDDEASRWAPQPTALAVKQQRTRELQAAIAEHEALQARPMRELLIALAAGQQAPDAALQKLAAIDQAVAPLRLQIQDAGADVRTTD